MKRGNENNRIKLLLIFCFMLCFASCNEKVEEITIYKYFIYRNFNGHGNNDSTVSIRIIVNTYKDFFKGRESIFSFKRNVYYIKLPTIDTSCNLINAYMWSPHKELFGKMITDSSGYIKLKNINSKQISLTIQLNDTIFGRLLNGDYKLKYQHKDQGKSDYQEWDGEVYAY